MRIRNVYEGMNENVVDGNAKKQNYDVGPVKCIMSNGPKSGMLI